MAQLHYSLPDFTVNLPLHMLFVELQENHPDWMVENSRVSSVYGSFPSCILNGGRSYIREQATPKAIEDTFALLESHNLTPRLTFTNMLAKPEHLSDPYANQLLEAAARHGGEVIAYADCVADYARDQYGLKTVLSTTRPQTTADDVNAMLDRFDTVVLDYNHHKDPDYLSGINEPDRVEVMANEFCMKGCPYRQEHYHHNSKDQMNGFLREFACHAHKPDFFAHEEDHPSIFTVGEVRTLADTYGISQFKLVGRGVSGRTLLHANLYYLVRPEYHTDIERMAYGY